MAKSNKKIKVYNVLVPSKDKEGNQAFIRLGDKAYMVPPVGEFLEIPEYQVNALKRRYGNGFSRTPGVARKMAIANAPETLTNEQLLKEIERLQKIANDRFQGEKTVSGTELVEAEVPADLMAALNADEDPVPQEQEETVELTDDVAPVSKGRGKGGNK